MIKETWGPILWKHLHDASVMFEDDPHEFADFVRIFVGGIPCGQCQSDFGQYVQKNPVTSTTHPVTWAIDAHNHVNDKVGNPVLPYDEALLLVKPRRMCLSYTTMIAIFIVFIFLAYKKRPMKR